jgi:serine/threonine-protein kinase RsbW
VTTPTADVTLVVPAVPDSIAVIRQTVSGICEALGADARTVGDIKLAATEACTNVVLHAYAGREAGSIELDAYATEEELRLLVRDRGAGMTPAPMAEGLGLGLPLIAALTSTLTIVEPDEGGTEVSMTFALRDTNPDP